jgi:hypothetical protein
MTQETGDLIRGYYKEFTLDSRAHEYLKKYLRELVATTTIARLLLTQSDLDAGSITTYAHRELGLERLHAFTDYGFMGQPLKQVDISLAKMKIVPVYDFWLIPVIRDFLAKQENHLCVFAKISARAGDRLVDRTPTNLAIYREELYHFIGTANVSIERIDQIFSWIDSLFIVGVLTSLPVGQHSLYHKQTISLSILEQLVDRAEKLIISAYDGEGNLIWHRG